ncbi:hypothetical protein ACHAXM_002905 [Skeletonema potamos]
MSTATQRKAWNEAMRKAGAKIPSGGASGVAGRASDRRRKASRRDKARKSSVYGGDAGGSTLEEREYRVAIHMDMLEGVTDNVAAGGDDDDEYDEFEDLDDEDDDKGKKGSKKNRKRKSAAKSKAPTSAKYLRSRSLASILIEEANRSDSTAKQYVDAAIHQYDNTNSGAITPYPTRKFCPVTGLFGVYTEPKSYIPYANLMALDQIRERAPPWMNTGSSGTATYLEAIKTLRNDS